MLQAKLLGDAIEAMAKTVASKVGEVAEHFEQLFYQSSRVGLRSRGSRLLSLLLSNSAVAWETLTLRWKVSDIS